MPETEGHPLTRGLESALNEMLAIEKSEASVITPRIASITTTNGFCLVPESACLNGAADCRFKVLSPRRGEGAITVCFDVSLVARIAQQRRASLRMASLFWALCAQVKLAAYLRNADDFPTDGKLVIAELSEDEMLLAAHWRD